MNFEIVVTTSAGVETHRFTGVNEYYITGDTQPATPVWWNEVISNLKAGKYVHALKAYRADTGLGLKEAKQAVDKIRDGLIRDGVMQPTASRYT